MKKRTLRKLVLNKETIVQLNNIEMNAFRAGAKETKIGVSCYTNRCCQKKGQIKNTKMC
ncbi:MAG: class I lanthipeptide [Candidatus Aminicenantes bacterium]|nr:MAG: class I lanthipeptide [Candidatus Aminicenantes bacterium]